MLSIRTNVSSLDAQRNLSSTQTQLDSALSKLSSGFRITKAGDDAAGLGISSKLDAQYKSYNQAVRNANDGLSMVQTAEAGMNEIGNILGRLRELSTQYNNASVDTTSQGYIETEATELVGEIGRLSDAMKFNGVALTGTLTFRVGSGDTSGTDTIDVDFGDLSSIDFDVTSDDVSDIDTQLDTLNTARASLGAGGNRLQSAINSVQSFAEATAAATSRIRDVDVAAETANMTRANILAQAGVSVLAQANQMPQMALKLLG